MGKINSQSKLNSALFKDKDIPQKAIRDGYGEGLLELGSKNERVVALSADLTESTRASKFQEEYPERFIEVGVAEQNLATVAAGLGVSGKIPFISSFSAFSPGRNWEQIRTTIAYNDSNVKIAGHHTGFSPGPDGATHQAMEDIATMRTLPNMRVIVPCDAEEARKATLAAADISGPVYIRLSRSSHPLLTTKDTKFNPGKAEVFWGSKDPDVLLIACGYMVYESLLAAKYLEDNDIDVTVLNVHTIKPLDEKTIIHLAGQAGSVVCSEEHTVYGGLGGAVAELLSKNKPVPMEFVGVSDTFGESGDPKKLRKKYGLTSGDIIEAAKQAIKRK